MFSEHQLGPPGTVPENAKMKEAVLPQAADSPGVSKKRRNPGNSSGRLHKGGSIRAGN